MLILHNYLSLILILKMPPRISVFHGSGSDQNSMLFGTAGSSRLAITSAGNIGIGTISPSQMLNLNAASGDAYVKLDTSVNGGLLIDVSGTQRGVFANDSAFGGGQTDIGIGAKGNMIFRTGTSGYTERMRIASGGAVTFNTTGDVGSNNPGVQNTIP